MGHRIARFAQGVEKIDVLTINDEEARQLSVNTLVPVNSRW